MTRQLRVPVVCGLVAAAALALGPVAGTLGQAPGPATADKEGWWSRARDATAGTPVPAAPETVPDGAIAVAATAGQVDKVAAIGIVLDAERGSVVERFTLTLKEAEGIGAQRGSDAAIVACPVTAFFAPEDNGALQDAPAADCEAAAVAGMRADDGTWTFDLAAIADVWLDPFGTLNANGIRLDPEGGGTFQVSLTGIDDAVFDVAIAAPVADDDLFDASTTTVPGGFSGPAAPPSGSGGFTASPPPTVAPPDDDTAPATTAPTTAVPVPGEGTALATPASRAGDTGGNLPGGVPLLLAAMLAVSLLTAWHLGPAGRAPHARIQRSGGVSRALAARPPSTGAHP